MKKSGTKKSFYNDIIWILIGLVIILGVVIRFIDLEADPPLYFEGSGQSLSTDPYHYTFHARNKVFFGESDPLHQESWRVFEISLVSGLSYLLFSLFGVSRYVANLTGVFISLAAIFIFAATMRKIIGFKGALLVLLLLLINKVLFVYGRLPYVENGMMLWMAILFFVFVNYRHHLWGQLLLGLLGALAGLLGKMFGIVIFIPVFLAFWMERPKSHFKDTAIIAAGGLVTTVIWAFAAYGGNLRLFFDYLFMQSLGLYGMPDALTSPVTFFERLISFGNDSSLYYLAPALGIGVFLVAASLVRYSFDKDDKSHTPIYFLLLWVAVFVAFFMIQNYRPIRYAFMLYLPMVGLIGYIFSRGESFEWVESSLNKYLMGVSLFFIFWIFLEQTGFGWYREEGFVAVHRKLVWLSFLPAAVLALLEIKYCFLRQLLSKVQNSQIILALIIFLAIFNFGRGYWDWHNQKSYNIKEAAVDLGQILNQNAVLCGPIAPTFLMDNWLKGMIYAIGVSGNDTGLFKKFPATHFSIDAESSGRVIKEFPQLAPTKKIADYWIRDADVTIVDIYRLTDNPQAAQYRPTFYEIGRKFMDDKFYDSALVYMEQFAAQYPDNKSVLLALSDLYAINGNTEIGLLAVKKAASLYPRDFSVIMALGSYYEKIYVATGDRVYLNLALDKYKEVLILNPYQADEITKLRERFSRYKSSQ
jgi:4-amino-4-deoxy-L-arabinose transferase-like glycosyltransferase